MTKIDLQYDLINGTPASASPVEANFSRAEQHINQELVERDGTVAMRAQLKLVGDPVADLDAAPKQYVDSVLPVGIIMMYGGAGTPPGGRWAVCNGAEVQTADYPELYAIIGYSYGGSAGRFNLPALVDSFPIGAGGVATVGGKGGTKDAVVPAHTHPIDHSHPGGNTSTESGLHQHGGVDHLHRVDIGSGGANARHTHSGVSFDTVQFTPNPSFYLSTTNPNMLLGAGVINAANYQTGGDSPDHAHSVNGWSGAADRNLTTGNQNAYHVHGFTTPQMTGASGSTGVAATNANLPPYVGVTYIIRAK